MSSWTHFEELKNKRFEKKKLCYKRRIITFYLDPAVMNQPVLVIFRYIYNPCKKLGLGNLS